MFLLEIDSLFMVTVFVGDFVGCTVFSGFCWYLDFVVYHELLFK